MMLSAAFETREKTTTQYNFVLLDEGGDPISGLSLDSFTLTLYNEASQAIINLRDAQDILGDTGTGTNGVTIDKDGLAIWTMSPLDNVIVDATGFPVGTRERHVALFIWTYSNGNKIGNWDVGIDVLNIGKVT